MSEIKQNRQQWDALARRSGPSWSKLHVGQHGSSFSAIESQFCIELEQFLQSLQVFKTSISLHGAVYTLILPPGCPSHSLRFELFKGFSPGGA